MAGASWLQVYLVAGLALLAIHETHCARLPPPNVQKVIKLGSRELNDRPIIGILSQPGSPAPKGGSYIAASYVKWVEAAGARVVPIMSDSTEQELKERFNVINGLLLPGGGASLRPGKPFYDTAAKLVKLAIEANDHGDYFPVHATCLGLEALSIIISGNTSILSVMDALDAAAPLLYTDAADTSALLNALPHHVITNLQDRPLAMENHHYGLLMTSFENSQPLRDFFKVLSLSLARDGLPYVSTMEAHKYPIYATQWHPEKNAFEWASFLHIPHSPDAVEVTQEVANFFVSEARKNKHAARDALQEEDMLIYNWKPVYTGRHESGKEEQDFQQTYVFGPAGSDKRQPTRRNWAELLQRFFTITAA